MQLQLQNFQQLLQRMCAAVQRSSSQLIDFSVGSMLRAVLEANASLGLWLQWVIVQTLGMTRASTSGGADLDSWMADFSLSRQPAVAAQGVVTFSRMSTNIPAVIPVGVTVKSAGGNKTFFVSANSNNPSWQNSSNAYLLPAGVQSVDLPVTAGISGASGNIMPGALSLLSTAIPGVDFVTNSLAFAGGADAETDNQFRTRFQSYINSRSRATAAAVEYALSSIQQSMRYKMYENTDPTGAWRPGTFLLIVDDGSGHPNSSLLSVAYAAVDAIRPIGCSFSILPPTVVPVDVTIIMSDQEPSTSGDASASIVSAVTHYINQLPIGATLFVTRIIETAYRAAAYTQSIAGVTINSTSQDLNCPAQGVMIAGSVSVH